MSRPQTTPLSCRLLTVLAVAFVVSTATSGRAFPVSADPAGPGIDPAAAAPVSAVAPLQKRTKGPCIAWCIDFDGAFVEAEERNVPVILGIIQDGEAENERIVTETYTNRDYIRLTKMAVNLVGSRGTSANHGTVDGERDGRKMDFCAKFGGMRCFEHQDVEVAIFREFASDGEIHTPFHIILHPGDRRELGRFDDYVDRGSLSNAIRRAQRTIGVGLDPEEWQEVKVELAAAQEALAKKQYAVATKLYRKLADRDAGGTLLDRARADLDGLEEVGRRLYTEAEAAAGKKEWMEACTRIRTLETEFAGWRKLARDTKKLSRKVLRNPEAKEIALALEQEPEASEALAQAVGLVDRKNWALAIPAPEQIVQRLEQTTSGSEEGRRLEKLTANPKIREEIAEHVMRLECTRWLRSARKALDKGETQTAREHVDKVLASYPESEYAAEARELARRLEGGGPSSR